MNNLGACDFIRLENSWSTVRDSVSCAITALRGIYTLMDVNASRHNSEDSNSSNRGSFAINTGMVLRRLSNAFVAAPLPSSNGSRRSSLAAGHNAAAHSRNNSLSQLHEYRTSAHLRNSFPSACPTVLPDHGLYQHTDLSPIPPTPALFDANVNPFDASLAPAVPKIPDEHVAPAAII